MSIIIKKPCLHCNKLFDSKRSHGVYCSASCRTLHGRAKRASTKTVRIGLLSVEFQNVADKSYEELHALVANELTPEMLEIIHNEQPTQTSGETHNA